MIGGEIGIHDLRDVKYEVYNYPSFNKQTGELRFTTTDGVHFILTFPHDIRGMLLRAIADDIDDDKEVVI